MSRSSSHDRYIDVPSGILKNRFYSLDTEALASLEADLVAVRSYELVQNPVQGKFDPFRDGTGRAQREFFSQLAAVSGWYIAWEGVSQAHMLEASIESFHGEPMELVKLVGSNLWDMLATPAANLSGVARAHGLPR